MKLDNGFTVEICDIVKPSLTNDVLIENKSIKNKKGNQPVRKDVTQITKSKKRKLGDITETNEKLTPEDMLSWAEFKLPEEIVNALAELGFKSPTKIQQLSLPAAIHGKVNQYFFQLILIYGVFTL